MSQDLGQKYFNNGINFTTTDRHDTYSFISPTTADLSGKNVLITGASKGVGKATAISYARAGASGIAIAARSSLDSVAKEIKEAAKNAGRSNPNVVIVNLDVTDRNSVEAATKVVSEAFDGRVDILINNAGSLSSFKGIPETDPDEWWRDWEVNVKGIYLTTRAFWPLILKSSLKIIINLSSIAAVYNPTQGSAYGSTKLAILRLTECINEDHGEGKDGILAIAVHPGGVETELALKMPKENHIYLVDTPELAGDTLLWLGSERRDWLAGRYISACWDMQELQEKKGDIIKGDLLKVRLAVNLFPEQ
ncbi:oxidoreductase-like protein [Pyrenochaeta sp. MPI-SDFR-AT-0127]|nr:oxidoreductase-like protein [Pyrenochaeta sp. MPI-SDFR-AT-0127]